MPKMPTPTSPVVGMKNWNEKKQRWDGVICQVAEDEDGKECVLVLDVVTAEHETDLDAKIAKSIETKPWMLN